MEIINIGPQPGPQTKFMESPADIVFYGGGAGGGKTFALLLEPIRHVNVKDFNAVIFRRTTPEITNPGGMWDKSLELYKPMGLDERGSGYLDWEMSGGMNLKFSHMEKASDRFKWQGAEVCYIGFDEVTHFTKEQFFYMLSRNRSTCGVKPYVRATCNPDADSWVAAFLSWWINPDTGFPIPERDGEIRYFIRHNDNFIWCDDPEELKEDYPDQWMFAKSVTFIRSMLSDNKILMEKDPTYIANLHAQSPVEKARLLDGNWKIKASSGIMFNKNNFKIVDSPPGRILKSVRYWDRAATKPHEGNKNPDWSVGTLMHECEGEKFYIEDVNRFRDDAAGNQKNIKQTAVNDGARVTVALEQDPGQAGKQEANIWTRILRGFRVIMCPVSKDKTTRAHPFSAAVANGHVYLKRASWNETFLSEHDQFPVDNEVKKEKSTDEQEADWMGKDDQVDSASGGYNHLTSDNVGQMPAQSSSGTGPITSGFRRNTDQW